MDTIVQQIDNSITIWLMYNSKKSTISKSSTQNTKRHRHVSVDVNGEEAAGADTSGGGATDDFYGDKDMENLFSLEPSCQGIFENEVRKILGNLEQKVGKMDQRMICITKSQE